MDNNQSNHPVTISPDDVMSTTGHSLNAPKPTTTNKKKKKKNKELTAGYEPGIHDVLCGRGKSALNHIGNRRFRTIVAYYLPKYLALKSRSDKTSLAMKIVGSVRKQGGQFLKLDPSTHVWYEIGDKMARDKVAHALRDAKADRTLKKAQPLPHHTVVELIRASESDDVDGGTMRDYASHAAQKETSTQAAYTPPSTETTGAVEQPQISTEDEMSLDQRQSRSAVIAAREDPTSVCIADILLHLAMSRGGPPASNSSSSLSSSSKQNLVSA